MLGEGIQRIEDYTEQTRTFHSWNGDIINLDIELTINLLSPRCEQGYG